MKENDHSGSIWQSGNLKSLAEYVHVCFINVQLSLHENVVFSIACIDNAAYIMFIMWNSISGLDTWYHFQFNISCGVAVMVRSHKKNSGNFLRGGERGKKNWRGGPIFEVVFIFRSSSFLMSSSFLGLSLFLRLSSILRL